VSGGGIWYEICANDRESTEEFLNDFKDQIPTNQGVDPLEIEDQKAVTQTL
jgi:hypothetical protein